MGTRANHHSRKKFISNKKDYIKKIFLIKKERYTPLSDLMS